MLNTYTVSFFGHRVLRNSLQAEKSLEKIVYTLLKQKEYVEFLVGRDGEFDLLVASVIRRIKKNYRDDNSAMVWVMPYHLAEYSKNNIEFENYYDEIMILNNDKNTHFKAAFQNRNKQMIDKSNLAVFYVERQYGGAYKAMCYAIKKAKNIINIAAE